MMSEYFQNISHDVRALSKYITPCLSIFTNISYDAGTFYILHFFECMYTFENQTPHMMPATSFNGINCKLLTAMSLYEYLFVVGS